MRPWRRILRRTLGFLYHRMSGRDSLPRPLCFPHIPKVGGTSLEEAIADAFRPSTRRLEDELMDAARFASGDAAPEGMVKLHPGAMSELEAIVAFHLFRGDGFVHGHFPVSARLLDRFAGEYVFMTLLRHPVDRWISRFRYDKLRYTRPDQLPRRSYEGPLEEEIRAVLASPRGVELARAYTWYLGGAHADGPIHSSAAVRLAKENLAKFDILGTCEEWTPIVDGFERHFGKRLTIPTYNRTSELEKARGLDYDVVGTVEAAGLRPEIEALCAQDMEIYEYCRELAGARRT